MLKSFLDAVMERRARQLVTQVEAWLPSEGPVLDLGSGTGHFAARLQRDRGLDVVTADVSDIHVVGRPPILIGEGSLPFEDGAFSCACLLFVLAYPNNPADVLAQAARVSRGPIILVQTVHAGSVGWAWFRVREFVWTTMAFRVSKLVGYVPPDADFRMQTQRFYTAPDLRRELSAAGLRIRAERARPVLPFGALVVTAWLLERGA